MRSALCVPRRVGQLSEFGKVSEESKMGRGGSRGWGASFMPLSLGIGLWWEGFMKMMAQIP